MTRQRNAHRIGELKALLESRRSALVQELHDAIRATRARGSLSDVLDETESPELDIQDDIRLAFIQLKIETRPLQGLRPEPRGERRT